jgi:excisionase family DNA binding protein
LQGSTCGIYFPKTGGTFALSAVSTFINRLWKGIGATVSGKENTVRAFFLGLAVETKMSRTEIPVFEIGFAVPPKWCSSVCENALSDICMEECALKKDCSGFKLRKGATLENLPEFPINEFIKEQEMKLLTISEAAEILRISKSQLYSMVARKQIPVIRISERRIVIAETDLETFIEKRRINDPSRLFLMLDDLIDQRKEFRP